MNLQAYSKEQLATIHQAQALTQEMGKVAAGNKCHIVLAASLDVSAQAMKITSATMTMEERIKYQEKYLRTLCKMADMPFTFYRLGQ